MSTSVQPAVNECSYSIKITPEGFDEIIPEKTPEVTPRHGEIPSELRKTPHANEDNERSPDLAEGIALAQLTVPDLHFVKEGSVHSNPPPTPPSKKEEALPDVETVLRKKKWSWKSFCCCLCLKKT